MIAAFLGKHEKWEIFTKIWIDNDVGRHVDKN